MASTESIQVGAQLDQHHAPETNGRMSACRKCGMLTDSPMGLQHAPHASQIDRSNKWLTAQSRLVQIDRARAMRAL